MVSASEDQMWWKPSRNPNEEVIKVWAFSDFLYQVNSDIEVFEWLFQIEDDGHCVIPFGLRKEKT